jgi:hypothetical protein
MTGDLRLPPGSPDGKGTLITSWTLFFQHIIQRLRVFIGDSGDGGIIGLVPAPDAGDSAGGKYLKADATWDVPPGTSTGTITATGALTLNHLVIGNGGVDEKVLASSGTTSTVLHGDAAGPPTFAAVTESELSITDNTTGNVSITAHGFAPKAPNDSTKFLNGVGAYAVPSGGGSGTVTHTGGLTANQLVLGNGTADITALGSLGTTTTVYHGNAAGAGTFAAVVEADITLANNTTNNVTTAKHGFTPILPNDATKYLDGTGAYTVPAGTGGTGNITSTGAAGSEPGSPSAGDLYFPNNGFSVERYSGSIWVPWGPLFPLTDPSVSAPTTWVNQGGATVSTTNGGIILTAPTGAGQNIRARVKTAPSTPYTVTARFIPNMEQAGSNNGFVGIGFRESSSGKFALLAFSAQQVLGFYNYTDATTFSASTTGNVNPLLYGTSFCFRIADDGTNRIASISYDGVTFQVVYSVARTTFLTADQVAFVANSVTNPKPVAITLLSWLEA